MKPHQTSLIFIGAGLMALAVALYLGLGEISPTSASPSTVLQDTPSSIVTPVSYASPDLTSVTDLNGNPVALSDYRGSVLLVNLWATWCPPCRAEMPVLESFYQKHKNAGFVVIAIDQQETRDVVAPFVEENLLSFPVWLDLTYEAERKFKTNALPSSYVIDRQGSVRLMWVGGISEDSLETHVSDIIYNE